MAPVNPDPTEMNEYCQTLFRLASMQEFSQMPIERLYAIVEREKLHLGEHWHGRTVGRLFSLSPRKGPEDVDE